MIRRVNSDGTIDAGGPFTPIFRPRVVDRIAASARLRVCLIVAPAGFGKTTAMHQFLEQSAQPILRFSARPEHATILGFIRGLADAAVGVAPGLRTSLTTAYEASRHALEPASELARWIATHLTDFSGIIAVDDLHLCTTDAEVRQLIAALVSSTHEKLRWMFASRAWSGLPVASWLAYGLCDLAIDERDLAFSSVEAREFAKATRLSVRDEEVLKLVELTEGWPTALSFALRNSTRSHDLAHVRTTTRDLLFAFLAEQEYESLSESERELLEFSAVLGAIDLRVLESAGFSQPSESVQKLRQAVAFIAPGEREGLFALHDLIREFFVHRALLRGSDHARSLHVRVASALEKIGEFSSALDVLVRSSAPDLILPLLRAHGVMLVEHGASDIVIRAIAALDSSVRSSDGVVLYLRGLLDAAASDGVNAERLLRLACETIDNPTVRREILLRRAILAGNSGGDARPMLVSLIDDPLCEMSLRVEAWAVHAIILARAGDHDGAAQRISEVEAVVEDLLDEDLRARILQRIGLASLDLGRLDQSLLLLERAARLCQERDLVILASRSHACLALLAMRGERNLAKQLYHARAAHRFADRAGSQFDVRTALLHELHVVCERAVTDEIETLCTTLSRSAPADKRTRVFVQIAQSKRSYFLGEFDDALRYAETATHAVAELSVRFDAIAVAALAAYQAGQIDKFKDLIAMGRSIMREVLQAPWDATVATSMAEFTVALACQGQTSLALRYAKHIAKDRGMASTLLRQVAEFLIGMVRGEAIWERQFLGSLDDLRALDFVGFAEMMRLVYERVQSLRRVDAPRLTPSEQRILQLLGRGLTSKQIAQEIGRSVFTVQAHLQNIFGKLGVHDRGEAIEHAVRHGLVNRN